MAKDCASYLNANAVRVCAYVGAGCLICAGRDATKGIYIANVATLQNAVQACFAIVY